MCDTPVYNNGMNTIGMGDVVTPGMNGNKFGSGDRFDNIFGHPAVKKGPRLFTDIKGYREKNAPKPKAKVKRQTLNFGQPLPTIVYAKKK